MVNHLKKARGEIWPKRSERRNNTKNYQDEDKKSAINKNKKIYSQVNHWFLRRYNLCPMIVATFAFELHTLNVKIIMGQRQYKTRFDHVPSKISLFVRKRTVIDKIYELNNSI